jgi:hypothetical protein
MFSPLYQNTSPEVEEARQGSRETGEAPTETGTGTAGEGAGGCSRVQKEQAEGGRGIAAPEGGEGAKGAEREREGKEA